jgi:hypothetical protein
MQQVTNVLLPTVLALGMGLPAENYAQIAATVPPVPNVNPAHVPGVLGCLPDFHQLHHVSQRESIPVPYLQQHHFRTLNGDVYKPYLEAAAVNPAVPLPPEHELFRRLWKSELASVQKALATIVSAFAHFVQVVQTYPQPHLQADEPVP